MLEVILSKNKIGIVFVMMLLLLIPLASPPAYATAAGLGAHTRIDNAGTANAWVHWNVYRKEWDGIHYIWTGHINCKQRYSPDTGTSIEGLIVSWVKSNEGQYYSPFSTSGTISYQLG